MRDVGIVIIGRNEGERLIRCLKSLAPLDCPVVYVDSGSTDGSQTQARIIGAAVVDLDTSISFSAGRARNAGFSELTRLHPQIAYVQFIDGDCELNADWMPLARAALEESPSTAVVCGRRKELYPDASVYNYLCDLEWDTPCGNTLSCGGDALMRRSAFESVGGFRPSLIAGEEPELCRRLRESGWTIQRLSANMTQHDAAMRFFSQWWRRAVRAGHAYAEVSWVSRHSPNPLWRRESRSIWLWGLLWPLGIIAIAPLLEWWSLLLLLPYPLLAFKTIVSLHRRWPWTDAIYFGAFCVVAKFPQAIGQLRFHWNRWRHRTSQLIEYKTTQLERNS